MKRQSGFTLIELIMVIVILGILAATALPKFMGLQADARMASANGALGALSSASTIAHAALLARGWTTSGVIEGTTVTFVNSYPDAASIQTLAGINSNNYTIGTSGSPVKLRVTPTGATPGSCSASYTEASAPNFAPVIATEPNPLVIGGC